EIRFATNAQLASAMGTPLAISSLGLLLQSGNASINRDLAVIEAPPNYPGLVQQGDVWVVDTALRSVHQFRGGTKVSTFTLNADDAIGGVATDANGNLYIAGTGLGVYRINWNSYQVNWLLKPDEVAGTGLTVRDIAVASDGTLYITYLGGSGRVDKFTPDGSGGYTRTQLGTTGLGGGDRGNHHSWLTNNGKYLLTSGRWETREIVVMDTTTGAIVSFWDSPDQTIAAEITLDPFTNQYVLFLNDGATADRLYALPFNPQTGQLGTTPIQLNTDTDDWVDGLAFDPLTGDLYMSVRYNQLVKATYAQYLAALAGIPFDIDLLPRVYNGSEVNVARDMVVTNRVPEPAAWVLLALGLVGLVLARRPRN
ncbi:MAG: PEP-CTERM sorting domain-containing protein, partial [Thermoguttaceae bacterium]|nr:PEP-CTERM sorting domain-containing protein [Thermoguttaceae bacterium]